MHIHNDKTTETEFVTYPDNLFVSFIVNFHRSNDFFDVTKNHIQMLIISLQSKNFDYKKRTTFAIGRVISNLMELQMHKKLTKPSHPNLNPYCHQDQMAGPHLFTRL